MSSDQGLNGLFEELSGKSIQKLSTNEVVSRDQSRKHFENIEELAESISAVGQLQPIIVTPRNASGKYVIRSGERRWRACSLLGISVDAIVTDPGDDESLRKAAELVENIQREDLRPLETAEGIQAMLALNKSQADVARMLGKTRTYVSIHVGLLQLPPEAKALADAQIVTDADTLSNLRKLAELDMDRFLQVCQQAEEEGLTRAESRRVLASVKGPTSKAGSSTSEVDTASQPQKNSAASETNREGSL